MCLWRCSIAIILGFVWYFSDCGQTLIQYFFFSLCCFTAPVFLGNFGQESSTQTDEVDKDQIPQESLVEVDGENTGTQAEAQLEPQYPHVKKSLQQVFECMYAELVLPWYHVPEPCESQPLHQALSWEFDCVIERVVRRARDFDVCEAVVGSIRILTVHLHNAKHSDREPLFSSRAEEIAVLREFSEALVRNLFPESLWCQDVNRCALNEIVALKGLELLVTWLSDPDNLNQLVVSQLDSVTPQSSVEELCASDVERASLASHEGEGEGSEVILEGAEGSASSGIKSKKKAGLSKNPKVATKGKKLKERLSMFVDKIKSKKAKKKKMKEMEQNLMWRAMQGDLSADDDGTSREGSIHSQQDSDRDDGDLENYLACVQEDMMEFKLSYEMWRVGCWAVSIPCVNWENEELIFTIHLEEKNNPENLQWDIKKTNMDIIYFRNRWQHSANLPSALEEISDKEVSDEVQEEIRASVELFLQELVSDDLIGHTQLVFQFLCPLNKLLNEEEHHGGVWGLLSGLAYFLTPGQEEEETSSPQTETTREDVISPQPETTAVENCSSEKCTNVTIPAIIVSQCDSPSDLCEDGEPEMEPQSYFRSASSGSESLSQDRTEDVDNPLTSHLKMFFKGLSRSRSQESLASTKAAADEDQTDSEYTQQASQNGGPPGDSTDGPSWLHFSGRAGRKQKVCFKMSGGLHRTKGKDQGTLPKGEESQVLKSQVNWEQLEATKAIFELLKEISGNSILLNIFDAILKPVMPILKKKVNSFLNKMNPTEVQMATYIDTLRKKQWPDGSPAPPPPPRSDEEKNETRDRAHSLINARYSNYLILKKTDMESVFNLFQDREENKKLVYALLSFLLREFLPNENGLHVSAAALQKVNNSTS